MPDRDVMVAVVGDGPAGSALVSELCRRGVEAVVIGPDDPWRATYGAWADDIADIDGWSDAEAASVGDIVASVRVVALSDRVVERPYLLFDNKRLRTRLRKGIPHIAGIVGAVSDSSGPVELSIHPGSAEGTRSTDGTTAAGLIRAEIVIDATGWPSRLGFGSATSMGWQTAWGAVLAEVPAGPLGTPTLMDFSDPDPGAENALGAPTFAYAFPVTDGWLVEETVLAHPTSIPPERLRPLLAQRLGWTSHELIKRSVRVEQVEIPMGAAVRLPPGATEQPGRVVPFGAAAGLAHPATGYQVATSLRLAPRVADALALAHQNGAEIDEIVRATWDAVWPQSQRRSRRLHEYGLDVLMRLDADGTRQFFETFFSLPASKWSVQMRSDVTPGQVASVMSQMFASAPWSLKRRLMNGDQRLLRSALRG